MGNPFTDNGSVDALLWLIRWTVATPTHISQTGLAIYANHRVDVLLSRIGAPWGRGQLPPDDSREYFRLMRLDNAVMEAKMLMVDINLFLCFGCIGLGAAKSAAAFI